MSKAAAFFDLDRTLLPGASGPIVGQALREVGLVTRPPSAVERLAFGFYDHVGESLPSMVLARQSVRMSTGWDRELVARAGQIAAARLVDRVQPWVGEVFAEHRRAGRLVVMASSSPHDVCSPLGEALGCDAVVATQYRVTDGLYDGSLDGPFVWGRGKLEAVSIWADDADVDLASSWAYSDSVFDHPLLSAVGHPVAVNPDPRLRVLALAKRWPIRWLDAPEGVPRIGGLELGDVMRLVRPEFIPYARFELSGLDAIPVDGPVLIVANHRSYFDPVALAVTLARRGRVGRFMAKREVTDAPVVGAIVRALGTIRVDRGTGSAEPLDQAAAALRAGEAVVLLPQGTIPRGAAFFDPIIVGKPGVAKLAALTDAPVVPIGLWGTEAVWPRSARLPNVTNVVSPPTVRVAVGRPVDLGRQGRKADVTTIMTAITDLLPPEARRARTPTADELARATPSSERSKSR